MVRTCAKVLLLAAALTGSANTAFAVDQVLLRAREGAAAMIRGQFDRAVALYDEALSTPDVSKYVQASIYSDRGVAKWRMNQTKGAVDDFNASIQISPDNPIVYNNRGNALMDLGHAEQAIRDFDRAITLQPDYGAAYNNRGNAYASLKNYDAAFRSFRKATALLPKTAATYNGRGHAQAELQRYRAAVRDLSRAVKINPKHAPAYRNRATANFELGYYQAAAADVTEALNLDPKKPQIDLVLLRAKAYAAHGRFREAIADFDKVLKAEPDRVEAYVERGILLARNKRRDAALGDFDKAIELDPKNAKALTARATVKLQRDLPSEALADVNRALLYSLSDPLALQIRGNIYEKQERVEDAIYDYQKALTKNPFQEGARAALKRLDAEIPADTRKQIGPAVAGWGLRETEPGRYRATNPNFRQLNVDLEMFGTGKPKILGWKRLKGNQRNIGLLTYHAGRDEAQGDLEYVAIVDTRKKRVLAIEAERWGETSATWTWQVASVAVTDPDGNISEVALLPGQRKPRAVARRRQDEFGSFFNSPAPKRNTARPRTRRKSSGSSSNPLGWLFR